MSQTTTTTAVAASMENLSLPTMTTEEAFMTPLPELHLQPLWTQMSKMVPPDPNPTSVPMKWAYKKCKPLLMEAGKIVGAEEAERRVLMLVNPSLEAPYTTDTIYGGLQLILPNEIAPAHRHIAFAMRFIIEGSKGFTAVEGEKMYMERGDVILTPSWHWHDHGNEGADPVIWLDGLNLPLFRHIPVNFAEMHTESRYPSTYSESCKWRHPWKEAQDGFASQTGPHRVHHYNSDGAPLSTTLGAQAEMVEPGQQTAESQESISFMYHVYEGTGQTTIVSPGGKSEVIDWEPNDTFSVPAWSKIFHSNKSGKDLAFLFAVTDRPLLDNLGLYRKAGQERKL
ncbi:putative gentisate 1,2-dioxygenase [Cadophora sp. DSE1049]|nr:putative gentisate 1,2-dioxygenase [Cadophora sp. DSE1049]